MRSGARRAAAMAKLTVVRTLESPSRSARIHTPNALMNWRMMEVGASRTLSTSRRTSHASAGPATMLPTTMNRRFGAREPIENVFAATAPTASR